MGSLHPPRNVQHITEAAQDYEYDAGIPLRYWLRSAQAMLQEVNWPTTLAQGLALIDRAGASIHPGRR